MRIVAYPFSLFDLDCIMLRPSNRQQKGMKLVHSTHRNVTA